MLLRLHTDYALRVVLYLAHANQRVGVERIASAYRISKEHLVKVVQQLVRLGYAKSYPGRSGGVELARPAEAINVGKLIADVEGRHGVLECVANPTACVMEPGCELRSLLMRAEDAFYATLERMTLADLLKANAPPALGGVYNLTVRGRAPRLPVSAGADRPGGGVGAL